MESFFGTLKAECVQGLEYRDIGQARQSLFSYIEGFYNTRQIRTSIGMSAPIADAQGRSPLPESLGSLPFILICKYGDRQQPKGI
jgi:transposase InsO family protein